jgi:hypothetical protein
MRLYHRIRTAPEQTVALIEALFRTIDEAYPPAPERGERGVVVPLSTTFRRRDGSS